jgi:protein NrfD
VILYLFLSHLAVGNFLTLFFVSKDAGVKFFRFNAGMAAILLAVAVAFRPGDDAGRFAELAFTALLACGAAVILYWATVGRALAAIRPAILAVGGLAGIVSVVAQAMAVSSDSGLAVQALAVASFLSSVALLGGACTAMVLGHWYLIIPSMQVSHLQSIVKLHIVSMVLRIVVVGAAVFVAIVTWQPGLGLPSFSRYITSVSGVFFWQRVLFGLAGPAVLSYLTWETAKIRSTQSATGILYVDFFTVVVGEVLAKYLFLATRVPV